jgi:uncharacterized protein
MNVCITGASGLIGKSLAERLRAEGHGVTPLVRGTPKPGEVQWAPGKRLDPAALANADAVVHLAGKNVATRWSAKAKQELFDSRVSGTKTISDAAAESFRKIGKPGVLISASAIGFYGSRRDEVLSEDSAPGTGFLKDICVAWENAAQSANDASIRVVHPRIGMVLSDEGGALAKMLPIFKSGIGGRIADGRQWWSWISLADVIGGMIFALLNPEVRGPVNFTAPNPKTNAEFTKVLGSVLHRPVAIPVPAAAIRIAMGTEAANETALSSARVLPTRLLQSGYKFQHAELREALQNVLR